MLKVFNVVRKYPAPDCLNDEKYNTAEVVRLLEPMFYGKCYLCEQDELSDPEIEHFDPHEGNVQKKYDWDNLFYACSRCNSIKGSIHKNLLNCCDAKVNVFAAIKIIMPSIPDNDVQISSNGDESNVVINNTVELLKKCFNLSNTGLRGVTRAVLIEKLYSHYSNFLQYRAILRDKAKTDDEKNHAKQRLKSMLAVSFPFSGVWRWHVLEDSFLKEKLEDLIDFGILAETEI